MGLIAKADRGRWNAVSASTIYIKTDRVECCCLLWIAPSLVFQTYSRDINIKRGGETTTTTTKKRLSLSLPAFFYWRCYGLEQLDQLCDICIYVRLFEIAGREKDKAKNQKRRERAKVHDDDAGRAEEKDNCVCTVRGRRESRAETIHHDASLECIRLRAHYRYSQSPGYYGIGRGDSPILYNTRLGISTGGIKRKRNVESPKWGWRLIASLVPILRYTYWLTLYTRPRCCIISASSVAQLHQTAL